MRLDYGLDGPAFESRLVLIIVIFSATSISTLGYTLPPTQWVRGLFLGDKAAGT